MKRLYFRVKEGVYCSWCVSMMKRLLFRKFAITDMEADLIKSQIKMIVPQNLDAMAIINYLDARGYHLQKIHYEIYKKTL